METTDSGKLKCERCGDVMTLAQNEPFIYGGKIEIWFVCPCCKATATMTADILSYKNKGVVI